MTGVARPLGWLLLVATSACGDPSESGDAPAAGARGRPSVTAAPPEVDTAAIDARAPGLRHLEGTFANADERSEWRASFDGAALLRIVERRQRVGGDSGVLHHYFRDGRHRLTREVRVATLLERDGPPRVDTIRVVCAWDAAGALLAREKSIDGVFSAVQPFEAEAYRTHVAQIAQLALVRGAEPAR
ncbi:MAG: hypothetical protein MUE41_15305 [Gemmatimonadaceae bacterium]|nr:hypothetical protein [Gemmatimonadaceae bacterium]